MGLRMDDMHAPTVPSGPSTSKTASFDATNDKRSLMELIDLKTKLEEELSALGGVLESVIPSSALTTSHPPHLQTKANPLLSSMA